MYKNTPHLLLFPLLLIGLNASTTLPTSAQGQITAPPTHLTLGKINALILDDVRLILLADGDLIATTRSTKNGRALYGSTGKYEGLARSGIKSWLLYNQKHQLTGTAHTTNITLKTTNDNDDTSPFNIFKKQETTTNNTSSAILILDPSGQSQGTIRKENDTYFYSDAQDTPLGHAKKKIDGTLTLYPAEKKTEFPHP